MVKIEGYWDEYKNLIIFSKSTSCTESLTCKSIRGHCDTLRPLHPLLLLPLRP